MHTHSAAMKSLPSLMVPLTLVLASISASAAEESFYVGTYTKPGGSQGIYHYALDTATGAVREEGLVAPTENPTFLAVRPGGKFLYAVNELQKGAVSAFAIEPDGKLRSQNRESAKGDGPAHLSVDQTGKNVLVANYGGGNVAVLPIREDGSLAAATAFIQHTGSGANPSRQKEPHAHAIYTDSTNRFAYVCDLGIDKVMVYKFDAEKGTLTPNDPPFAKVAPGSGPRHLAFHPKGYAYLINEMGNTVTVFQHDAEHGTLKEIQTVPTLPADFKGSSTTAEIFVHPNGKFLYGSNRGHDSIVVYSIDESTGRLTLVEHVSTQGKTPRNFAIDPSGKFLLAANQDTNNVVVFRIDEATGKLTPTGHTFQCGAPVCVTFVPEK